jgi:hypothetical protein
MLVIATNLFPVWVLLGGSLALAWPGWFTWFNGDLITWGLAVIMLGMGITLTVDDFNRVLKLPRAVGIGFGAHYVMMHHWQLPGRNLAIAPHFHSNSRQVKLRLTPDQTCPGRKGPISLLHNSQKCRGRTSAWQGAPGLQNFQANLRICRPGAPTGRFLPQPPTLS